MAYIYATSHVIVVVIALVFEDAGRRFWSLVRYCSVNVKRDRPEMFVAIVKRVLNMIGDRGHVDIKS